MAIYLGTGYNEYRLLLYLHKGVRGCEGVGALRDIVGNRVLKNDALKCIPGYKLHYNNSGTASTPAGGKGGRIPLWQAPINLISNGPESTVGKKLMELQKRN